MSLVPRPAPALSSNNNGGVKPASTGGEMLSVILSALSLLSIGFYKDSIFREVNAWDKYHSIPVE